MDPLPPPPPPSLQPPPATASTTTVSGAGNSVTTTFPAVFPVPVPTTNTSAPPAEAQNHITHAAANPSPGPTHAVAPSPHHPPYAEMIYTAIGALKEKNGSSKRAIAKFIERAYTDLPPTHSALLTHHLKRLKNNGHLVMVKKSYKLPRSDSSSASAASAVPAASSSPTPTLPTGASRGRGRPPKPKPTLTAQPNLQPLAQPIPQPAETNTNNTNTNVNNIQQNAQPVLVALGLVDDPNPVLVKKSPGRPRKVVTSVGQGVGPAFGKRGRGRPVGSKVKKSPGRPRKPKSVTAVMGPKRGRGRPSKAEPKTMVIPYAGAAAAATTTNVPVVAAFEPNTVANSVVAMSPRPRGRPKKVPGLGAGGVLGVSAGILAGKRRGRPPKVAGVIKKPKKHGARPVGRPRKNTTIPFTEASESLLVANGDLKRKLEYVQLKVRQAVIALKPQLSHESPATAIAAVQELEEIATMDINAPFREEPQVLQLPLHQQPQPQQHPQPQLQPDQQQQQQLLFQN
ncbi:histone H1 [Ziziphus jujuba]|uniref:Histone H1 n=1 Tax=Ziziphus jujuba TaxID=326968 RepID=A0A6P4BE13_ZIZJJ|nr:histone H1 [Ziziphus jujuba]